MTHEVFGEPRSTRSSGFCPARSGIPDIRASAEGPWSLTARLGGTEPIGGPQSRLRAGGDADAASVRGVPNSRGVVQNDQLSGIDQCGGGSTLCQDRSLDELLTAASLVGRGLMGYRAATAAGQGLSALAQATGRPATGLEDQAEGINEGRLTTTGELWRISTNFGLDSDLTGKTVTGSL